MLVKPHTAPRRRTEPERRVRSEPGPNAVANEARGAWQLKLIARSRIDSALESPSLRGDPDTLPREVLGALSLPLVGRLGARPRGVVGRLGARPRGLVGRLGARLRPSPGLA